MGKKMKCYLVKSAIVLAAINFLSISPVWALPTQPLQNGSFSNGLNSWTVGYGVTDGGGYAKFEQNDDSSLSTLSQSFILPMGSSTLSFEQEMIIEGGGPPGTDVFTASLLNLTNNEITPLVFYHRDTDGIEWALGTIDGNKVTFDVSSLTATGDIGVLLSFELYSDKSEGDPVATVILDNVSVVPIPGAFILALIGIATVGLARKFNVPGKA
jgi:hypothetical protein